MALLYLQFWYPRTERAINETFVENITRHLETLETSLIPFLLQNQLAAINELMEALETQNDNWKNLTLKNIDGVRLYPLFSESTVSLDCLLIEREIQYLFDPLAHLSVCVETLGAIKTLEKEFIYMSWLLIGIFVSVLMGFAYLAERTTGQPLSRLSQAAVAMAQGDFDAKLPKANQKNIKALIDTFAAMRRTIRDEQEQIVLEKIKAEQANVAKSQFIANMNHELRTPMNAILGAVQMFDDSELNSEQKELLAMLAGSGKLMLEIINDILDFTKIESGSFTLERIPVSVLDELSGAVEIISHSYKAKGLPLKLNLDDALWRSCLGDPVRLRQLFLNLLGNALKFTQEGFVELTASLETTGGTKWSKITVRDTGIGISPAQMEKVFKPFTQADASTTRKYGGTGLGLTICKQIVESMGGHIRIESEPGVGSAFHVFIPFIESTSEPKPQSQRPGARQAGSDAQTDSALSLRVLVVDDTPVNLKVMEKMLHKAGHKVTTATTGLMALEQVKKTDFDLILMDWKMPEMDGLTACREIRKLGKSAEALPIIMVTANTLAEDVKKYFAAGANGVLPKPVKRDLLYETLNKCTSVSTTTYIDS